MRIELDIGHARFVRALAQEVSSKRDVGLRILSVLAVEVSQGRGAIGILGNASWLTEKGFGLRDGGGADLQLVKLVGVHLDARGRVDTGRENEGDGDGRQSLLHDVSPVVVKRERVQALG